MAQDPMTAPRYTVTDAAKLDGTFWAAATTKMICGDLVIDPCLNFGRITVAGRGIRVDILEDRVKAGEPLEDIAKDMSLSLTALKRVLRQHAELQAD